MHIVELVFRVLSFLLFNAIFVAIVWELVRGLRYVFRRRTGHRDSHGISKRTRALPPPPRERRGAQEADGNLFASDDVFEHDARYAESLQDAHATARGTEG